MADNKKLKAYVIGRNAGGHGTLMHNTATHSKNFTACGVDIRSWSRAYTDYVLDAIWCMRCQRGVGKK